MSTSDKRQDFRAATAAVLANPSPASIAEAWRSRLIQSRTGKAMANLANVLIALRHAPEWEGVLHFDESSYNTVAKVRPPWEDGRPLPFTWSDEDDVRTAAWMQHRGINAARETTNQAVQTIAREHSFHPIRDYLDSLAWDGVPRIDDWAVLYLGAESSDYVRAVGAKWLIGGVARIYKPGVKNDTCLILEGPQGILKSSALRAMAEPWFTDDMPELGTKDSALQTRGVWLIELSELDAMTKGEVSRIKAFMSRQVDRFRPPFGRRPIEAPRECFFAGTVNQSTYLKDETGARRFWPLVCGHIDIDSLRRDKNQLWAEARDRFRAGDKWWLDSRALVQAATIEQQYRYEGDPWDEPIREWTATRDTVTIEAILEFCIGKKKETWTQADKNRIGRTLRSQGWERFHAREGDKREWKFRKGTCGDT